MSTPSDRTQRFTGQRSAAAAILLVLFAGVTAHAAPAPQSVDRAPATAQEKSELRRSIESRYEILPVTGGVLLKPRQERAGIRTLEVTGNPGDQIAVNGERVSPRTLRDWLGEDADPVLRLQAVPAAQRRQVVGLDAEAAARPETAVPEASKAPAATPEAATGETASDTDVNETTAEPSEVPEAPEPPEPAGGSSDRHTTGDRVNLGGGVHVRSDEVADEVMAIGGAAEVEGDVRHDVMAVGGPVRITGTVGGDVAGIGGSVYLGPHAVVNGNVTSVGGSIEREPGAVIHGSPSEVGVLPFIRHHRRFHFGPLWGSWGGVPEAIGSLMSLVLTGLLVCLVLLVARRSVERVDRQLTAQPWPSVAVGLAGSIFFWPLLIVVTVLLAITIVGCVLFLLYPFLLLYVGLLLLLGYATVAYRLGRWLEGRFSRDFGGPYAAALVGVLALHGWSVLGNLLDLLPGPFGVFAFLCGLFGTLASMAALIVGFGAVILSRFGLAPGYWPRRGAPPVPPGPSMQSAPPNPPLDSLPLTDRLTHPPAGPEPRWEEPGTYPEEPR
ncbi:MAG TPA: polymer-forming cytoskeletal protein [Thermoanaerobaculia bacterium]|jgi:hypothetical protein